MPHVRKALKDPRNGAHAARAPDTRAGQRRSGALGAYLLRGALGAALMVWLPWQFPQLERGAIAATVACLRGLLTVIGAPPRVQGNTLMLGSVTFAVVPDCTPLMPILLTGVAMFAFPASWRARARGFAAAIAVLWLYNLIRILSMFALTIAWPASFEFVHVYLWQTVTFVVILGIVVIWMRLSGPAPVRAPALGGAAGLSPDAARAGPPPGRHSGMH